MSSSWRRELQWRHALGASDHPAKLVCADALGTLCSEWRPASYSRLDSIGPVGANASWKVYSGFLLRMTGPPSGLCIWLSRDIFLKNVSAPAAAARTASQNEANNKQAACSWCICEATIRPSLVWDITGVLHHHKLTSVTTASRGFMASIESWCIASRSFVASNTPAYEAPLRTASNKKTQGTKDLADNSAATSNLDSQHMWASKQFSETSSWLLHPLLVAL